MDVRVEFMSFLLAIFFAYVVFTRLGGFAVPDVDFYAAAVAEEDLFLVC